MRADRWVFHRTVTVDEHSKMTNDGNAHGDYPETTRSDKIFRRYSIRYAPGTSVVPPGYGVELSVLHDGGNANRTLDEISEGHPWYPKVWPHVLKRKPLETSSSSGSNGGVGEEEMEGLGELVHEFIPRAEEMQRKRKREIQRLLATYGQEK